jgi:hypothetical protein
VRRPYGFERRRREDARRAKQEAKRRRKTERAQGGSTGPEIGEPQETGAAPGQWEWFSASRSRTVISEPWTRPDVGAPDDWVLLTDVADEDATTDGSER